MKKSILLIIAVLIASQICFAAGTEGKTELGLKGGMNTYWGDIGKGNIQGTGGLSMFWWTSDNFSFGFNAGASFLEAENNELYFKTMLYNFIPMVKVKLTSSSAVNPYLGAGFELMYIDPTGKDKNVKLPNNEAGKYNNLQFAIPFGGGLSIFVSDVVSLDLEALYHYSLTDYLDDIKKGEWNDGYITATFGVSIYFGKPRDTDGDGIPDKNDGDPRRPEDYDGFQDFDGIPDPDNDQDRIPDIDDKAPNNPEDHDGYLDTDGIPDPDNDGDGIKDADDNCPGTDGTVAQGTDTKEDIDGYNDEDGCPDPDNDGDGILDKDDKCPNEAETFNGYEDEDGCPDTKPEIDVGMGQAIVLEGVFFASGSATLSPDSRYTLDKVVRTMRDMSELEVEIRGYTDNTGSYQGNVNLSKRRAESVKEYLVRNGIAPYRIVTKGFGPEDPIAPNTTRDGRAKNRRIEFFRLK